MKKLNITKWLLALACLMLIGLAAGCSKEEGFGGNATLSGVVNHHETPIPLATVFIKFGAIELPGTTAADFDASTIADETGTYNFTGLHKGDYYLYSVGFDSSISEAVIGGVFTTVAKGEDNIQDVAVTE